MYPMPARHACSAHMRANTECRLPDTIYVCMYVCMYARMYECVCVCVYIYAYICIYAYRYIDRYIEICADGLPARRPLSLQQ